MVSMNINKQAIIEEIKNKQLPVVICGAGIIGETLLSILTNEGVEVACFSDNSIKTANTRFCNKDVIYTPDLKSKFEDAILIISAVAIKDVVDLVTNLGFSDWYAGGLFLKDLDVSWNHENPEIDYNKFATDNCILCHDAYLNPDRLFFRSIDLIITERCSLKCKDCSNLMQYYEKPINCDTDMLRKEIDAYCSVIDEVMDFRVIGGEAFMNKDWPIIVKRLIREPKAKRVVLYANGTIVPKEDELSLLKNEKVLVIITDYGELSKRLDEMIHVFEEKKIVYHILKIEEWLDCSKIEKHDRSNDEKKEVYRVCCAKNMITMSDGKLYRCPFAANASRLKAVPDEKSDYVDLFQNLIDGVSVAITKDKVRNYILHKECLTICDYCKGRPLSGIEVQPAIQTEKSLVYKKYN